MRACRCGLWLLHCSFGALVVAWWVLIRLGMYGLRIGCVVWLGLVLALVLRGLLIIVFLFCLLCILAEFAIELGRGFADGLGVRGCCWIGHGDAFEHLCDAIEAERSSCLLDDLDHVGDVFERRRDDDVVELVDRECVPAAELDDREGFGDEVVQEFVCDVCVFHASNVWRAAGSSSCFARMYRKQRTERVDAREIFVNWV